MIKCTVKYCAKSAKKINDCLCLSQVTEGGVSDSLREAV